MSVYSLFDSALQAVLRDYRHHERELRYLPSGVKTRVSTVMAKRGMLNDRNLQLVLHEGITELDLSECDGVSVRGLGLVRALCPRLKRLDLSAPQGCRTNITSAVFSQLFSHCRRLQVVSLKCCALLDNAAVCSLAHHCPSLLFLSVAGCYLVSDRSLLAIATKCKHLTVLDVANTKVSTEGVTALGNGVCAKALKELNISRCLNVTDEAIQSIASNCPRLSILVFHGCPLLTGRSREIASDIGLKQLTWTVY